MHFLKRPVHVVEESIGMATNYRGWFANNQMKIFFSHNDRKDKVSGPTEKGRKRREKGGRKGAHFSKSLACGARRGRHPLSIPRKGLAAPGPRWGRFAIEFATLTLALHFKT